MTEILADMGVFKGEIQKEIADMKQQSDVTFQDITLEQKQINNMVSFLNKTVFIENKGRLGLALLVEKLQSKIEGTQKQTQDTLSDIHKLEHKFSDKFTDLKEQIGLNLKDQLENINNLKDSLSIPTVVFQARHPSTLNPGIGAKIVFTNTMQDSSHSYDSTTGVFRAPFAGTYLFNVQLCLAPGLKWVNYAIVVGTKDVTSTLLHDNNPRFCNSATAIVVLQQDDDVHIKVTHTNGNALQEASGQWNTFTGVMLTK